MSLNKVAELARQPRRESVCLRLSEIADLVGGELEGKENPWISGLAGIQEATPGQLTFLANKRYRSALKSSQASAVLVDLCEAVDRPAIRVENPAVAFMLVLRHFAAAQRPVYAPTVHSTAILDASVQLGHDVSVGANVVIETGVEIGDRSVILPGVVIMRDCQIGSDCIIYPNVTLYENCEIGHRVIVHAGAVIGSDGFGYVHEGQAVHKIPHLGRVVLEDDVEIGANTCIDRATTGTTRIGRGAKIDNLVQIAHNVQVGEYSFLCAQVGISGSTEIGRRVKLAGQVGIIGHIKIGDGVSVGAQSGISKSVADNSMVSGYPAKEHKKELRQQAALSRLPDALEVIRDLRHRVAELERAQENRK